MRKSQTLVRLAESLFTDQERREKFVSCLTTPSSFPRALIWCKTRPDPPPFPTEPPLGWQPDFVDRVLPENKPGAHRLHQDGFYYCLDFSSVFEASVVSAVPKNPSFIIDVCSAPGGKAIFSWMALKPAELVCNEIIRKRAGLLRENLNRCGVGPAATIGVDPSVIGCLYQNQAPLVIVDAPCSGQSLAAEGYKAPGAFHPATINMNSNRQRRIIAESSRAVGPEGYLAYMTCTYSRKENEAVVAWFLKHFPAFSAVSVPHLEAHRSHLSKNPCYRLWPDEGLGAGGFTALFHRGKLD